MQTTDLASVTATPAIPEFNTSLGTLNSITVSYTGSPTEDSAFTLTNTAAGSETFKFSESLFELNNTDATIDSARKRFGARNLIMFP